MALKEPHYGQKTLEYLKGANISIQELADKLNMSRSTLYNIFKQKHIQPLYVSALSTILGKTTEFFGISSSELKIGEETNNTLISYSYLKKNRGYDYTSFLYLYFENLLKTVKRAKKKIVIIDYLGNNYQIEKKQDGRDGYYSSFHGLYRQYLNAINEIVEEKFKSNQEFVYERIVQVPLELNESVNDYWNDQHLYTQIKDKLPENLKKRSFEDIKLISIALDQLYDNTITHFEFMYRVVNYKSFRLKIIPVPIRNYSYLIIDDEIVISEYDRSDKNGNLFPDLLFNQEGELASKMIETYNVQLEEIYSKLIEVDRQCALDILKLDLQSFSEQIDKSEDDTFEQIFEIAKKRSSQDKSNSQVLDQIKSKFASIGNNNSKVQKYKRKVEIFEWSDSVLSNYFSQFNI